MRNFWRFGWLVWTWHAVAPAAAQERFRVDSACSGDAAEILTQTLGEPVIEAATREHFRIEWTIARVDSGFLSRMVLRDDRDAANGEVAVREMTHADCDTLLHLVAIATATAIGFAGDDAAVAAPSVEPPRAIAEEVRATEAQVDDDVAELRATPTQLYLEVGIRAALDILVLPNAQPSLGADLRLWIDSWMLALTGRTTWESTHRTRLADFASWYWLLGVRLGYGFDLGGPFYLLPSVGVDVGAAYVTSALPGNVDAVFAMPNLGLRFGARIGSWAFVELGGQLQVQSDAKFFTPGNAEPWWTMSWISCSIDLMLGARF